MYVHTYAYSNNPFSWWLICYYRVHQTLSSIGSVHECTIFSMYAASYVQLHLPHKPWGLLDPIFCVGAFTHGTVCPILKLMDRNGEEPIIKDIAGSTGSGFLVATPTLRGENPFPCLWHCVHWTAAYSNKGVQTQQ